MDLTERHDNVTAADVGSIAGAGGAAVGKTLDTLASTASNIAAGIRNKAKAKDAQKTSDAGKYWEIGEFKKGLIKIPDYIINGVKDKGISEYSVLQLPAQPAGTTTASLIPVLQKMTTDPPLKTSNNDTLVLRDKIIGTAAQGAQNPSATPTVAAQLTSQAAAANVLQYWPYAAGGLILFLVLRMILKKK